MRVSPERNVEGGADILTQNRRQQLLQRCLSSKTFREQGLKPSLQGEAMEQERPNGNYSTKYRWKGSVGVELQGKTGAVHVKGHWESDSLIVVMNLAKKEPRDE